MLRRTLIVVTAGLLLAAEAPKDDAAKKDRDKLQGAWKPESGKRNGKDVPAGILDKMQFTFDGDKVTVKDATREQSARFTLDPSKKPPTIDFGKTSKGIYQLKGDILELCWVRTGRDRPKKFASPADSGTILLVLKRVKK